jgi:hypothetical protein
MKCYIEKKNKVILSAIIEFVINENKENNTDIDDTITVVETDIKEVLNELDIQDFSFEYVKGLRNSLTFHNFKIMYKDKKILKVAIDMSDI